MIEGVLNYARRYLLGGSLERRRVRYEIGLRTRRLDVSGIELEALHLSPDRSKPHAASGGPDLEDLLDTLPLPPHAAALDLGCGKGAAMLTLAKYFSRVDGVDLSRELLKVAAENLRKCGIEAQLIHADAEHFREYDPYTLVYMYNPFPEAVMRPAMCHLAKSLADSPRPFWLVYKNSSYHDAVTAAGFRTVLEIPSRINSPLRVYRFGPDSPAS